MTFPYPWHTFGIVVSHPTGVGLLSLKVPVACHGTVYISLLCAVFQATHLSRATYRLLGGHITVGLQPRQLGSAIGVLLAGRLIFWVDFHSLVQVHGPNDERGEDSDGTHSQPQELLTGNGIVFSGASEPCECWGACGSNTSPAESLLKLFAADADAKRCARAAAWPWQEGGALGGAKRAVRSDRGYFPISGVMGGCDALTSKKHEGF